jgi:hypothetical protein
MHTYGQTLRVSSKQKLITRFYVKVVMIIVLRVVKLRYPEV